MLEKRIEELESSIKSANELIFESLNNQDLKILEIRENGRRTRDRLRSCVEQHENELYVLKILKLCHRPIVRVAGVLFIGVLAGFLFRHGRLP